MTAAAMALGVALLLITLAGINAVNSQNPRSAWLNTGPGGPGLRSRFGSASPSADASTSYPLWWLFTTDQFGRQTIDRVDVAATGPSSPVPPGISHLPGPGQFYASPALSHLLRSTPAAWGLVSGVPYGQTTTYGDLATRLGDPTAQEVGAAVGRNPLCIIVPCHRVVGAGGKLTGYAGGVGRKLALLDLERSTTTPRAQRLLLEV